MDKEICKNCRHERPLPEVAPYGYVSRCLVWNRAVRRDEFCQWFEMAEGLQSAKGLKTSPENIYLLRCAASSR